MSGFVSTVATGLAVIARDDRRNCDETWHGNEDLFMMPQLLPMQWEDDRELNSWRTMWWPYPGGLLGAGGTAENPLTVPAWWAEPWTTSGCNGRLGFVGYTRDAYGSVLGGCTVRCYRASTDEQVSKVSASASTRARASRVGW